VLARLANRDMVVLGHGLIALLLIVVMGVGVTGRQLTKLTFEQGYGQAFAITRDEAGVYTAAVLGNSTRIKSVYELASCNNIGTALKIEAAGVCLTVPTVINIELAPTIFWFKEWRTQFVTKAIETKLDLRGYSYEFGQYLDEFFRWIKR